MKRRLWENLTASPWTKGPVTVYSGLHSMIWCQPGMAARLHYEAYGRWLVKGRLELR